MGLRGRSHSYYPITTVYDGPAFDAVAPEEPRWFAIHTRSRHERTVTAQLQDKGVRVFLPQVEEVHQWSDRRKLIQQPLFSCYTFVHIAPMGKVRQTVLHTSGVIGFVGTNGVGIPIPDKEIEDIKTLVESKAACEAYPYLTVGERVRIVGGSMDGVEGLLVAKNTDRSLVVSIQLIQRSIAVRLDGYNVKKIGARTELQLTDTCG